MRIAIFGGRFDPPHRGHLWVAQQVLEYGPSIDKVLLVPASHHQWKETQASSKDRLAMLESITTKQIEVSDIELKKGGISYTIDTIKEVKKQTNAEIFWIVGADILAEFDKWDNTQGITDIASFLVFPRDPYHLPQNLPKGFSLIESPDLITTNVSSTLIRKRIQEGKSISEFVPATVEEYIKTHGLYESKP